MEKIEKIFDPRLHPPKVAAHELGARAVQRLEVGCSTIAVKIWSLPLGLDHAATSFRSLALDMTTAQAITVHIPGPLRGCCAGASELAISAASVRDTLAEIERRYPVLYRSVCDETGAVRRHINVFVNTNHMRDRNGLDTPLSPGDEVTILPAVSGG